MSLSMYELSVPTYLIMLRALDKLLDQAEAFATAKKIDPAVLLGMRLAPDMFPLTRQVQIACDFAKGVGARLAGVDVPVFEDKETTIADLKARIAKTIGFLQSLKASQFEGSEDRTITLKFGGEPRTMKGVDYLIGFANPNFYFHLTAAYGLLRHAGLNIGKMDFFGRA